MPEADIECIIEIVKAMYKSKINETSQKLKNIDYINTEALKTKIEKEITEKDTPEKYTKIIALIESLIQD